MTLHRALIDGTSIDVRMKGVGRYAFHLALQLDRRLGQEWEVVVGVATDDLPAFPASFRGRLVRAPRATELVLGMLVLPRLIRRFNPDLLVRPAEKIGRRYGLPTLTVCHDLNPLIWAQQPPRPLARRMLDGVWERLRGLGLRHSDRVICNSSFVRRHAIAAFGLEPDRVGIAPCGVDEWLIALADCADRHATRSDVAGRLGCEGYILTFATGDAREGYAALPGIWAAAKRAGYPGALVVAGVKAAAPYADELCRAFAAAGLAETVSWVPFLDHTQTNRLAALYAAADFYLELSRHEGFGMQLVEAMACGAACFSTGCGALAEVGGGFPLALPADAAVAGRAIADAWRAGAHRRDVTAQVAYARGFTWDIAGVQATAFARAAVGAPEAKEALALGERP